MRGALLALAMGLLAGCGGGGTASPAGDAAGGEAALSPTAVLGERIFRDTSLSASGRQSCASCHSPDAGHAAPNDLPAQSGGPQLDQPGRRSSPSIRYLAFNGAFRFADDGTPTGG